MKIYTRHRVILILSLATIPLLTGGASAAPGEFGPDAVDGLRLWLRADAGVRTEDNSEHGGSAKDVARWADQSGKGNHVANESSNRSTRPEFIPGVGALDGKPALEFGGKGGSQIEVTDWLMGTIPEPFELNRATIFMVIRMEEHRASSPLTLGPNADAKTGRGGVGIRRGSDEKGWFCVHNSGDGNGEAIQTTEPRLDARFHVLGVVFDTPESTIRMVVDGSKVDAGTRKASNRPLDPVRFVQIGGHGVLDPPGEPGAEWFFGGQIAEIVVFDRILTNADTTDAAENEFNAVGWQLQQKYGLPGAYVQPILPIDTDQDGILDGFEEKFAFLDPAQPDDATADQDGDGLSNLAEYQLRTALDAADTDGDGLADGAEVNQHRTDPLKTDTDDDGLGDGEEIKTVKTDPAKRDSDGDGSPDGAETFAGTDPLNAQDKPDSIFEMWDEEVVYGTLAVAMDGTVLQFEEAREKRQVEVKRSEDGGKTWSDTIVVGKRVKIDGDMSDDGRYKGDHVGWSGMGSVIVDENTGDIMVFATDLKPAQVCYRSRDHGKSWQTEEIEIKPDVNGWLSVPNSACDPGSTLRYGPKKGRLLQASRVFVEYLNKGKGGRAFGKHYANAIYSDDGGKTWTPSAPFPLGGTGESGLVELRDGTIYHNSRTHMRPGNRRIASSHDAGETWVDEHEDDELFDGPPDVYGCKAGLLRLPGDDRDVLIFSSPGRRDTRTDITVWVSFDGGGSWPLKRMVRPGAGNYTWLAAGRKGTPSEGQIYLLAGKDWMARFNLAWIMETAKQEGGESSGKANSAGPSEEIPVLKDGGGQTQWFGQDPRWYAGDEAMLIADSIICFQRESGGWSKARFSILNDSDKAALRENPELTMVPWAQHIDVRIPTLDNGATFKQMNCLALVYNARAAADIGGQDTQRVKESFLKGVDYILNLQYDNGGWPQQSRRPDGNFWSYTGNITFNDNVMINALMMLQSVAGGKMIHDGVMKGVDLGFVDQDRRRQAVAAVKKGIECILQCQIIVGGKPTVWCQQHDPVTFRPRGGRPFEPPALTAGESIGIIRYLMSDENPTAEIIGAVQNAVAWYDEAKVVGKKPVRRKSEKPGRKFDVSIKEVPDALPQWGRYHYSGDLGDWAPHVAFEGLKVNQPIFVNEDRKVYDRIAPLSYGRRIGYNWMGSYAVDLLIKDYPAWQQKHAPGKDMRKDPIWKELGKASQIKRHLLLDSRIIEKTEGLELRVGKVQKHPSNPLFIEEEPWEARYDNGYPSVMFDEEEGIYKCWYNPFLVDPAVSTTPGKDRDEVTYLQAQGKTGGVKGREFGLCYATSKDGIKWEKPLLDIVTWDGKPTNILMRGFPGQETSDVEKGPHGIAVLKDLAGQDPARRYKMILSPDRHQTAVSFSPDGLHWSAPSRLPQLDTDEPAYNFSWLPAEERFAVFCRRFDIRNDDPVRKVRAVSRLDTADFKSWSEPEVVLIGTDRTKHVYHMPVFHYQGVYLGLPAMFDIKSDKVHTELAWSPDSRQWNRIDPGNPLIATTEEKGHEWGCIYSAQSPVILEDEIRMYYASSDGPHYGWRKGCFNLATLRPDGFAGYETTGDDPGVIVTKRIYVTGRNLHITADVAEGGYIRVAAIHDDVDYERTIDACKPVTGNVTDGLVTWENARGIPSGKVAFEFKLKNAKLYSFSFEE